MKIFIGYYVGNWEKILAGTLFWMNMNRQLVIENKIANIPSFMIVRENKEHGDHISQYPNGYFPTKDEAPFMIIYFF